MTNRSRKISGRVLVVDDDPTGRLIAREALESDGLEVVEASDGLEAIERFSEARPDLVLLDVRMPEADGFEVCRRCRLQQGADWTPIVMVTSMDDMGSIQRAYEVGATDFVTKPINWLILKHRVRYLLRAGQLIVGLRDSQQSLAAAERIARLGSWRLDFESQQIVGSEEFSAILGLPVFGSPIPFQTVLRLVHPEDRGTFEETLASCIEEGSSLRLNHRVCLGDGSERIFHTQAEPVFGPKGELAWFDGIVQDVTETRQAEEKIRFLAYHDALTKVGNRVLFKERLSSTLAQARRNHYSVGVLFLDLDHFKRINDTLGHSAGDELLKTVSARLVDSVRETDVIARHDPESSVSRLGGDEFTILLSEFGEVQNLAKVAHRILANLARPVVLEEQEVVVSASIGISAFPEDGEDAETLIRNADAAMYHSKEQGRNNFQFYTASMNEIAVSRMLVENKLRKAIDQGLIEVYYQPKVSVRTGAVVGFEALARWRDRDLGAVSPGVFIPIAEEAGLIRALGNGVLRKACEQLRSWHERSIKTVPIAVNVSVHQFRNGDFLETFERILGDVGVEHEEIGCEITESTLMDDPGVVKETLQALRERGVLVSLDDFGTGYSSLSYLRKLPIDVLKVDRAFVSEIGDSGVDSALTAAIIAMGKALGLCVIAEGVETELQRDLLTAWGCDEIQGFLVDRPQPAAEVEAKWLQATSAPPLPDDG